MAGPGSISSPHQMEQTFTTYNKEQGKAYVQSRPDYHPNVYRFVIEQHASTGGQFDTILDIGCGPGLAIRSLASHFAHGIGLDPSEGMVAVARSQGLVTSLPEPVRFEISRAEELGANLSPPIPDASIDLIVAANAAHWFDMPHFWSSAARVLKPGGSVALWTNGEVRAHPSMTEAAAVQAAMDSISEEHINAYLLPGNWLVRGSYRDLALPWDLDQPIIEFDQDSFSRKDWPDTEEFFAKHAEVDMDTFEKVMSTASFVTRWRDAHPDAVGTERDVMRLLRRDIERILQNAGIEKGKETVKGADKGVILMVKKKVAEA